MVGHLATTKQNFCAIISPMNTIHLPLRFTWNLLLATLFWRFCGTVAKSYGIKWQQFPSSKLACLPEIATKTKMPKPLPQPQRREIYGVPIFCLLLTSFCCAAATTANRYCGNFSLRAAVRSLSAAAAINFTAIAAAAAVSDLPAVTARISCQSFAVQFPN
jgi:hypothetical protein